MILKRIGGKGIMDKNAIYVPLQGRIGNQLFIYAFARALQMKRGNGCRLLIDDSRILGQNWVNSLACYDLPDVEYIHNDKVRPFDEGRFWLAKKIYQYSVRGLDYDRKFEYEKKMRSFFGSFGCFFCENGYMELPDPDKISYIDGYFQSESYFIEQKEEIKKLLDGRQFKELESYKDIDLLRNNNSVCISIKVEHNIGSELYDVCTKEYWKEAIETITNEVEDPIFFVCSDNVEYVLNNLIDCSKYRYVVQDPKQPVHVSLAAMNECKHYIIGNTTYGWWAQYLSKNENNKIVIAPKRWMKVSMPIDIYQDDWRLL